MKHETGKKSAKWIWLVAGLAALLVIAGVVLALVLGGGDSGDSAVGGRADLYWNIEREAWIEEDTGLSCREKAEDGMYHVLFAYEGQQVDLAVADKQVVNVIDTYDCVYLTFDADGVVVDAADAKTVATEKANGFYVQRIDGETVTLNSSYAMNGMEMEVQIPAQYVYNVDAYAETTGAVEALDLMDMLKVYANGLDEVTHVYIVERAPEAGIYWRVARMYDTEKGMTTRVPDENGIYTMEFAHEGELVELKCKDVALVNKIDAAAPLLGQFAFIFDDEGYIIDTVNVALALRGKLYAQDYHVIAIEGDQITVERITAGAEQGKVMTFTLDDACKIYHCCQYGCYDDHCGEVTDTLQLYDRVNIYSDLENNPVLIFVSRRLHEGPMYYNLQRKYTSKDGGSTTREKENGYYVFDMLEDGKRVTLRTKDKAIADSIDYLYHGCVGLDLDGDIITRVYMANCVAGDYSPGYKRIVTSLTGSLFTQTNAKDPTLFANCIISPDCKIYDVTGNPGVKKGTETTLQKGDEIVSWYNYRKEVGYIYVTGREVTVYDYCEYCQKKVKWEVAPKNGLGTLDSGKHLHYVVGEDTELEWGYGVLTKGTTLCLNLYGSTITHTSRIFVAGNSKLNIMGKGGFVSNGTHKNKSLTTGNITVTQGEVNIYDGTIRSTEASMPAINLNAKQAVVNLWGGTVVGGIDVNMGQLNLGGKTKVVGAKGELRNNIYVAALGKLNVKADWTGEASVKFGFVGNNGISINNGTSEGDYAGKLYYECQGTPRIYGRDGKLVVDGEIIPDEDDPNYRYCAHCGKRVMWMEAPTTGMATIDSGDHYHYFLIKDFDQEWGYLVLSKGTTICLDLNGHGIKQSSRIFVAGNSTLNILGEGTVTTTGKTSNEGTKTGAVTVNQGTVNIYGGTYESMDDSIPAIATQNASAYVNLLGGKVTGGIKINKGTLTLGGNAKVLGPNGEKTGNIYIGTTGKLNVKADWTGEATAKFAYINNSIISAANGTSEGAYTGKLWYECAGNPAIIGKDGRLVVQGEVPVDVNDPNYRMCEHCGQKVIWIEAPSTGMATIDTGDHYHYFLTEDFNQEWGYLVLTSETTICLDLNGHSITQTSRIFVGGNSTINIMGEGSVITKGTGSSSTNTGAVTVNHGTANIYGGTYASQADTVPAITTQNPTAYVNLLGGKVTGGVNIIKGVVTLGGDATVLGANGEKRDNIFVGANGKLNVKADWTGKASALFEMLSGGKISAANGTSEGAYTGTLTYECEGDLPIIGENGRLVVQGEIPIDENDPNYRMCQHCGQKVMWMEAPVGGMSTIESGDHFHYFLTENFNKEWGYLVLNKSTTVCLDLNGYGITQNSRIFVANNSTLNIMGEGNVTTTGTNPNNAYNTGTITVASGTVNIYGGTYASQADTVPAITTQNSVAYVNLLGGKVTGGVNIIKGVVTLGGDATVLGANGEKRDNIFVGANGKLNVKADWTGKASALFEMLSGGKISAANGTSEGAYTGTLTYECEGDLPIIGEGGKLVIQGNIPIDENDPNYRMCQHCGEKVLWMEAPKGGLSTLDSGEHYHYFLTEDFGQAWGYLTVNKATTVCLDLNGFSIIQTGRILVANNSFLNIMGEGSVTTNKNVNNDTYNTGAITVSTGTLNVYSGNYGSTDAAIPAITLQGTSAKVNLKGGQVACGIKVGGGKLTLSGDAKVVGPNGELTNNIQLADSATLAVDANWTGRASVKLESITANPIANGVSTGAFTGVLTLENDPQYTLVGEGGKLKIPGYTVPGGGENPDPGEPTETTFPTDAATGDTYEAFCDVCGANKTWTCKNGGLSTVSDGGHHHFFISSDNTLTWGAGTITGGTTVCLHMNGANWTHAHRLFVAGNSTVNIMGGGALITDGTSSNAELLTGSVTVNQGTVNVYGVNIKSTNAAVPAIRAQNAAAYVNLLEGSNTTGGVMVDKGVMTLGSSAKADSITVAENGKLNVKADWTGSAVVTFATFANNEIPVANGTSEGAFTGTLTMTDGTAVTAGAAGNLVVAGSGSSTTFPTDAAHGDTYEAFCEVCGANKTWTCKNNGLSTVSDGGHHHFFISSDKTLTWGLGVITSNTTICLHTNGSVFTNSTRLFVASGSTVNIMGGGEIVTSGTSSNAEVLTGCVTVNQGTVNVYGVNIKSTNAAVPAIRVQNATAYVNLLEGSNTTGGVMVDKGVLTLGSSAKADSITVAENGKLNVKADWTGTAKASFASIANNEIPVANGTSEGAYTGSLQLTNGRVILGQDGKLVLKEVFPTDAASGDTYEAFCEVCGENKTWTCKNGGLSTVSDGGHHHFFISSDKTLTWGAGTVNSGTTVCLHMNGANWTHAHRLFVVGNSTVNIMGGGAMITNGTGNETYLTGGVTINEGTVNVYGTELKSTNAAVPALSTKFAAATANINDGVITGGINADNGVVSISGSTTADSITVAENAKLNILNDWTGEASVAFGNIYAYGATVNAANAQCGALVEGVFTPGGSYTGTLTYKELSCLISGVEGALKLADAVQNG